MNCLRLTVCLLVCLIAQGIPARQAQAQQPFISKVPGLKSDSLVLFGYYFKWPDDAVPGNDFVIGLLGDSPFTSERVTSRFPMVGKRTIRVLAFDSVSDYQPCHILFVADAATERSVERTPQDRLAAALEKTATAPVLVVTESQGFARRGAMANFVVDVEQNRVNVEVNEAAIQQAKLRFTRNYLDFRKSKLCILVR